MAPHVWWNSLSRVQRWVLFIAWMGWVFDVADTALFNFAKGPMLTEMLGGASAYKLHGPETEGAIMMVFIVGWSIGGLLFGLLADRWGRTRTLALTVLLYCVFTGLTALCETPGQVMLVRFVTGLGIGGEWAAGAALVAEALPDTARAGAATLLQTAAAFGPALAALANLVVARTVPEGGSLWKPLFLIGILPAAVALAARLALRNVETVRPQADATTNPFEPLLDLWRDKLNRKRAGLALAIGFVGIAGAGNVSFWLPNMIKAVSTELSDADVQVRQSYAGWVLHIGTLLGVFLFPYLCQKWGRKRAFGVFFVATPISLLVVDYGGRDYRSLMAMLPLMSFFAIGLTAGFPLYFPELFSRRVRATGIGLAYNTGRILNAPMPSLTGHVIAGMGSALAGVVAVTASLYAIALGALPFCPETKGQTLPE